MNTGPSIGPNLLFLVLLNTRVENIIRVNCGV